MSKMTSWATLLALVVLIAGCNGADLPAVANLSGLRTLGELWEDMQNPPAGADTADDDGDGLPNFIEDEIGTKKTDRDTDHDGLTDFYEVFGTGVFDKYGFVPDNDQDSIVAPLDNDHDGDLVNDGRVLDTDGDGIANYLEYYGYRYDWHIEQFVSCEEVGCADPSVYKTDPLQASTDQDPYPDSMEVSGVGMDMAVTDPGAHPLVPACPNIVFELRGYQVTLNEDLTYGKGESVSKGTTWNREATFSHSSTTELNWETEVSAGGVDVFKFTQKFGGSYSQTNTQSVSTSAGGSVTKGFDWSESRSLNPTDAARIKLYIKVRNHGTSACSNIVPTLTLQVGGLNVATFEPGNAQVNMLAPGGSYPAEEDVFWVIDSIDTGTGIVPLSLTEKELRALETGAPVAVTCTQLLGDAMILDDQSRWVRAADTNEYTTRCEAVCASLRLDFGEGSFLHYLVYADDSPSAPEVTLRDALKMVAGAELDPDGDVTTIHYFDRDGFPRETNLQNWRFAFDQRTLEAGGYDANNPPAQVYDIVLRPYTIVVGKSPRASPVLQAADVVHFAYLDQDEKFATVCATDFRGILMVQIRATTMRDGQTPEVFEVEMTRDAMAGSIFTYEFDQGAWQQIQDIIDRLFEPEEDVTDELMVVVHVLGAGTVETTFGLIPEDPRPENPVIDFIQIRKTVRGTTETNELYVRTIPDDRYPPYWSQLYPVEHVWVFHELFSDGVIEMDRVVNWYEDRYGYSIELPDTWDKTPFKVTAWVSDGIYDERWVTPSVVTVTSLEGASEMYTRVDTTATDDYTLQGMDFDVIGGKWAPAKFNGNWRSEWAPSAEVADMWARWTGGHPLKKFGSYWTSRRPYLLFNVPYRKTIKTFDQLTASALADEIQSGPPMASGSEELLAGVYIFRTSEARIGKVEVTNIRAWIEGGFLGFTTDNHKCYYDIRYHAFDEPTAVADAPAQVLYDASAGGIVLNGNTSAGAATYQWTIVTQPGSATLQDSGSPTAKLIPDKPGTYVVKLEINKATPRADSDTATIEVGFPTANAGTDQVLVFQSGDVPRVDLDGTTSTGVRTWEWRFAQQPPGSLATIQDANKSRPYFQADTDGTYTIKLIINKGYADEAEDEVVVTVSFP